MKFIALVAIALTIAVTVRAVPNKICDGHTDKKTAGMPFAHPAVCNWFITCSSDGTPYVGVCPGGTFYDLKLTTCNIESQKACGSRVVA
ncbi:hypothetical protein IW150_002785 [Coemansia sp. RSA 2607]|nr:hypothetical protein IW150_002785 [Coemansia sp. RSA 2607]